MSSRSRIHNNNIWPFPLPLPFAAALAGGKNAVVSKDPDTVISLLGGAQAVIDAQLTITEVPSTEPTSYHDGNGTLDLHGDRLVGGTGPSAATDLSTKGYVDTATAAAAAVGTAAAAAAQSAAVATAAMYSSAGHTANWSGGSPTNFTDAINRLAAREVAGGTGPIA